MCMAVCVSAYIVNEWVTDSVRTAYKGCIRTALAFGDIWLQMKRDRIDRDIVFAQSV